MIARRLKSGTGSILSKGSILYIILPECILWKRTSDMRKLLYILILLAMLCGIASAEGAGNAVIIGGMRYEVKDGFLNLYKVRITDPAALEKQLSAVSGLREADLSFCGLADEELAAMRERLAPLGIKIVWTLKLDTYTLRTDAWVFSTRHSSKDKRLEDEHVAPLRYAVELRALDLGHNWISDVSFLEPMTELKVLILSDNRMYDLSVLKGKPLEYLEIFNTFVKDLSFLEGCDTLMDLNICDTRVSDLSPLYRLKNLKRLWAGDMECLKWAEEQQFLSYQRDRLEAWNFWTDIPTLYGWRGDEDGKIGHPRYEIIKAMFKEGVYYDFDTVLRPEQHVYLYKKRPKN